MTFEKWLPLQVARDAAIGWAARNAVDRRLGLLFPGNPESKCRLRPIVIMIANRTSERGIASKPMFRSLELRAGEYAEWPRLRGLPAALKRARAGSSRI